MTRRDRSPRRSRVVVHVQCLACPRFLTWSRGRDAPCCGGAREANASLCICPPWLTSAPLVASFKRRERERLDLRDWNRGDPRARRATARRPGRFRRPGARPRAPGRSVRRSRWCASIAVVPHPVAPSRPARRSLSDRARVSFDLFAKETTKKRVPSLTPLRRRRRRPSSPRSTRARRTRSSASRPSRTRPRTSR
eukprot:31532-Pelagococcus_subviridis.AAC.6